MTRTPALAIAASGLTRTFGRVRAVDDLDLAVPAGVVYGLLGPNGAGNTTTIRMLTTLLRPDSGTARDVNPISHLVTAERGLMNGTAAAGEIVWVLAAAAVLTAVFAPLSMRLYRNKG